MDVLSTCPLRVAALPWQPRPGAFAVAFVCKATYLLAPGTSPLAPAQEEPWARDEAWNDDDRSSLVRASDLVPFKRHADVILVGHAHAPEGRAVGSLLARLVVGTVDKTIAVHGDRVIGEGDQVSDPASFVRAPLRWERAAGGPGTINPVGIAIDAPGAGSPVPVPNLLPADLAFVSRRRPLPPIGFMPIAPWWPGRVEKLRHHAAGWDHRRLGDAPLPDDIDASYFNAAPPDQQVTELRPDERLVLENLHPDHPRLVTNLQAIAPRAHVETGSAAPHEVRLRCDTLWIDTDRGTASLVWRGNVRLTQKAQAGRIVVSLEGFARAPASPGPGEGREATLPAAPAGIPGLAAAHAKFGATRTIDASILRRATEALPFGQAASAPAAAIPSSLARTGPLPDLASDQDKPRSTVEIDFTRVARGEALPFGAAPSAPVAAVAPTAPMAPTAPAAPAAPAAPVTRVIEPPEPAPVIALPGLAAAHAKFGGTTGIDPSILKRPTLPFDAPPSAQARLEPAAPPKPLELPLDAFPIARCAAISASIARKKDERSAILEKHDLTAEQWTALEAHWAEAIQKELGRGKTGLLSTHDAAYVAQVEKERGEITVGEYARLLVSAERGAEQETLAELGLPRGALLRVQRVWMKKIAKSPALGKQVREAVQRAGEGE